MRDEAFKRIGHLYPKVEITAEMATDRPDLEKYAGRELTLIAWLWARTVTCPNPACGATMPLAASYWLSKKKHRQAWVEPVPEGKRVRFRVVTGEGEPPDPPKLGRGANFRCECCGLTAEGDHVKAEAMGGRMEQQLMAVVLEGDRERVYVDPIPEHEFTAAKAEPGWRPEQELPKNPRWFSPPAYGLPTYGDLFTDRQLVALTTFSDLVAEARERAEADARAAGLADNDARLEEGGADATAYGEAVATYLGLISDRLADRNSTLCGWDLAQAARGREATVRNAFARQALPMVWDFVEVNILADVAGSFDSAEQALVRVVERLQGQAESSVGKRDATVESAVRGISATDPPYYDNIGYADLSDFFYVWLRRSLREVFPSLFGTMLTPKDPELIATPYRQRSNGMTPEQFFEHGLRGAFEAIRGAQVPGFPVTLFYAFKQAETDDSTGAVSSTGWDTMLAGLLKTGLSIDATWPMRTELGNRMIGRGTNALASSIVLTCRPRHPDAAFGTRNELVATLERELPDAVKRLQAASIAPVDLAQSAIGPGMAVFSRYAKVLEPDGSAMTVRTALGLINQALDEVLAAEESEYDADTRWAVTWFTQNGFKEAPYGEAEVLATARNTSVAGLERAGIVAARGGKVRLLTRRELGEEWDPAADDRFTVWEACQHLVRGLERGGESGAADLARRLGSAAEPARQLAYRLYQQCDRAGNAEEARAYNALAVAWPRITALTAGFPERPTDVDLDFDGVS